MDNGWKKMFGDIEVISYDLSEQNTDKDGRDRKMESQLKEGLLNYGLKKGYIKPNKK